MWDFSQYLQQFLRVYKSTKMQWQWKACSWVAELFLHDLAYDGHKLPLELHREMQHTKRRAKPKEIVSLQDIVKSLPNSEPSSCLYEWWRIQMMHQRRKNLFKFLLNFYRWKSTFWINSLRKGPECTQMKNKDLTDRWKGSVGEGWSVLKERTDKEIIFRSWLIGNDEEIERHECIENGGMMDMDE